ncbi:hypothetical protein C8R44DRAFT_847367 [Mycena epipterygia]|nr:hypothetical protein C8R44DRAFT_847367 [Mycena epipterygia]
MSAITRTALHCVYVRARDVGSEHPEIWEKDRVETNEQLDPNLNAPRRGSELRILIMEPKSVEDFRLKHGGGRLVVLLHYAERNHGPVERVVLCSRGKTRRLGVFGEWERLRARSVRARNRKAEKESTPGQTHTGTPKSIHVDVFEECFRSKAVVKFAAGCPGRGEVSISEQLGSVHSFSLRILISGHNRCIFYDLGLAPVVSGFVPRLMVTGLPLNNNRKRPSTARQRRLVRLHGHSLSATRSETSRACYESPSTPMCTGWCSPRADLALHALVIQLDDTCASNGAVVSTTASLCQPHAFKAPAFQKSFHGPVAANVTGFPTPLQSEFLQPTSPPLHCTSDMNIAFLIIFIGINAVESGSIDFTR